MVRHKRALSQGDVVIAPSQSGDIIMSQPPSTRGAKKAKNNNDHNVTNGGDANQAGPFRVKTQPTNAAISELKSEISLLRGVISEQTLLISRLSRQMSSILTYLELSDETLSTSTSPRQDETTAPTTDSSNNQTAPPNDSTGVPSSSWTTDEGRRKTSSTKHPTITTATMAAMYCEEAERNRRASSLIISGILPTNTPEDDKSSFIELCRSQFSIDVHVTFTKRLGKTMPGKIQPLLVSLPSQHDAQHVLSFARNLRHSSDDYIRTNVFINSNRTKAESEAAFRIRESRRQTAVRNSTANSRDHHHGYRSSSSRISHPTTTTTTFPMTSLNAAVSVFNPSNNINTVLPPPPVVPAAASTATNGGRLR